MSPRPDQTHATSDELTAPSTSGSARSPGEDVTSRRGLLATVAVGAIGGAAGCTSGGSCDDVAITDAYTEVAYGCDFGPYVSTARLQGYAEGCPGTPTVELVEDGEVVYEQEIAGDGNWSVPAVEDWSIPGDVDLLRVRDASGELVAEEAVEVDAFSDQAGLFVDTAPHSLAEESVAVGEPVELDVTVGNLGGPGEYVVWLRVDGEPVARREGSADSGLDCTAATGSEYTFTHTFEEPGEYSVTVDIEALGPGDAHPARELGPVTVTEA